MLHSHAGPSFGVFRILAWLLVLGLIAAPVIAMPGLGPAPAWGDDEKESAEEEDDDDAEESPLTAAEPAEAKKLNEALKKAAKNKNATRVLPAMEEIEDLDSPEFQKILLKLLKHKSSLVAVKAAEMWEWRIHDKKMASKVWKASWLEKVNKRRYLIRAKTLKAFARAGHTLDAKQFKEVERTWRAIIGAPVKTNAAALSAIAEYFEIMKDKRLCKQFAEELDDPCANVNAADPSAMPMDWQERRWWLWKESKPAIVSALMAITGQEFDKTEEAKKWFQENEKTFGFKW